MKERSLVFFTLLMQSSVGLCLGLNFLEIGQFVLLPESSLFFKAGWLLAFLLATTGLASSFFHLKVPLHAWRAMSNLKTSWLSREILCASIYTFSMLFVASVLHFAVLESFIFVIKWLALFTGLAMIFCMGSAYHLRTVIFWYSAQTIATFYATAAILGLLIFAILESTFLPDSVDVVFSFHHSGGILAVLLILNLYFSFSGYQRLVSGTDETFPQIKKLLLFRFLLGILAALLSLLIYFSDLEMGVWLMWPLIVAATLSEFSGRVLFYSAQVPTGVYLLRE